MVTYPKKNWNSWESLKKRNNIQICVCRKQSGEGNGESREKVRSLTWLTSESLTVEVNGGRLTN